MPGRASKLQFFVYILRLLAKSSPRLERWLMFGAPLVCFIRFVCLSIESSIVLVQSIILTVHWLDVDTGWPVDDQDLELMGFTSWCCCFSLIRKKSSLFVSSLRRHLDPLSHIYIQFIKLIASRVATAQDGRTGPVCSAFFCLVHRLDDFLILYFTISTPNSATQLCELAGSLLITTHLSKRARWVETRWEMEWGRKSCQIVHLFFRALPRHRPETAILSLFRLGIISS